MASPATCWRRARSAAWYPIERLRQTDVVRGPHGACRCGRAAQRRSRLAIGLADRFGAALIGVAGRSYLPTFLADGVAVNVGENDGERQETAAFLSDFGQKFRAGAEHLRQVEWRGIVDYAASLIPQEARAADLVIVGRKPDRDDLYYALDPGIAIVRAGRPVLFVPDEIALARRSTRRHSLEGHPRSPSSRRRFSSVP